MRSSWSDPYPWIHLSGVAALPILLEICLISLASGDPFLPISLEFLLVAIAGTVPLLWMQWQRPFCIFSLLVLALEPAHLTDQQRRLLRFFKGKTVKLLAIAVAALMVWVLAQLYRLAPIATTIAPSFPAGRLGALLVAAIAFLLSNLFLQVPVSVLRVLLVNDAELNAIDPYSVEAVPQEFTLLGFRVKQILPPMQFATVAVPEAAIAPVLPDIDSAKLSETPSEVAVAPTEVSDTEEPDAEEPDTEEPDTEEPVTEASTQATPISTESTHTETSEELTEAQPEASTEASTEETPEASTEEAIAENAEVSAEPSPELSETSVTALTPESVALEIEIESGDAEVTDSLTEVPVEEANVTDAPVETPVIEASATEEVVEAPESTLEESAPEPSDDTASQENAIAPDDAKP